MHHPPTRRPHPLPLHDLEPHSARRGRLAAHSLKASRSFSARSPALHGAVISGRTGSFSSPKGRVPPCLSHSTPPLPPRHLSRSFLDLAAPAAPAPASVSAPASASASAPRLRAGPGQGPRPAASCSTSASTSSRPLEAGTSLGEIVSQLKRPDGSSSRPAAETHAAVALAPEGAGGRDVDVVRLALHDPAALAKHRGHRDRRGARSTRRRGRRHLAQAPSSRR